MPFGLNDKGFKRKRYADIRNDLATQWKEKFGENSRTEEKSVNGILISLIAYVASPLWMLAEKVYNNSFVHKAEGNSLSGLVENRFMQRRPAEKSQGEVVITGEPGTTIEAGFTVSRINSYVTVEDVEIGVGGTVVAWVEAIIAGANGNAPANTVIEIDTPLVGVDSVTNPEPIIGGREEETDTELKERYERSYAIGGSGTLPSIEAALLGLPQVRDARVYENTTMVGNNGVPPKSIAPFVYGGDDDEIARAIFEMKAGGIQSFGNIEKIVADSRGEPHIVGFTRPDVVEVFAEINLDTDSDFPVNGLEQVRSKIIEYIGGIDEDATEYSGLGQGQNIIYTRIIAAIQKVPGIVDIPVLKIGKQDPPTETGNVDILRDEVAITDWEKVVVN